MLLRWQLPGLESAQRERERERDRERESPLHVGRVEQGEEEEEQRLHPTPA